MTLIDKGELVSIKVAFFDAGRAMPASKISRNVNCRRVNPACQAGSTNRALTLREIFSSKMVFLALKNLLFKTLWGVSFRIPAVRVAA
jgi:hypothetical protein